MIEIHVYYLDQYCCRYIVTHPSYKKFGLARQLMRASQGILNQVIGYLCSPTITALQTARVHGYPTITAIFAETHSMRVSDGVMVYYCQWP